MKPTLKIYDAAFQAEIKRMLAHVKSDGKGPARALNAEAYHLANATLKFTRRARRASIEALGYKSDPSKATTYVDSKGRTRTRNKFTQDKDASVANYIAALASHGVKVAKVKRKDRQIADNGKKVSFVTKKERLSFRNFYKNRSGRELQFSSRAELATRARKWIAKKLRSIGFLASTWRLVVRKFDRYAKEKAQTHGEIKTGKPYDSSADGCKRATGKSMVAVLQLKIGADKYGNTLRDYAAKLQRDALQRAIVERTGKIQRRLGHEIREGMQKDGFPVTA